MENEKTLNRANLLNLYIDWTKKYGDGRNHQDLRFGQWIHIYFEPPVDVFYIESAKTAYRELSKRVL